MERCFIATEKSKYLQDYLKYYDSLKKEKEFVKVFLKDKGIESDTYRMGGDGVVNAPFKDYQKSNIVLEIKPTANDAAKFGTSLLKPHGDGVCAFRKNSTIAKEFAQKCIDEQIIVNLWYPRINEYFDSMKFLGYHLNQFRYNDVFYVRITSDHLSKDETPNGFIEIKASEFFKMKEEFEEKQHDTEKQN